MINTANLQRCEAFIACHVKNQPGPIHLGKPAELPIITVSRQAGARCRAICEKLMRRLEARDPCPDHPWTLFDKNLIQTVLEDHEHPLRLARFMPDALPTGIVGAMEEILGLHPSDWSLARETTETMLKLAHLGHVILVGRGSTVIAQRFTNAVHFRLIGSMSKRIERILEIVKVNPDEEDEVMHFERYSLLHYLRAHFGRNFQSHELGPRDAEDFIRRVDRARRNYVKTYFQEDVNNPELYDMIINTDRLDDESIVRTMANAVLSKKGEEDLSVA